MVATSFASRSVTRSEPCNTTSQRTHNCRCSSTRCNFSRNSTILGNHLEVSTWTDQCFLGSAFEKMESSKSQCGVIAFLTHEPPRYWHGEFQIGHLVYWTSNTIKRVVRSTLATEAYSISYAVEEAQWLRSVLAEMWPSVPSSLPRSLNLCQTVKSNKGTGSDKRLRIVTVMLNEVFCGRQ